jgi:subtilase family domain protein
MKRTFYFIAAMLAGWSSITAQDKINPMGIMILNEYSSTRHTLGTTDQSPVYSAIVTLNPGANAESLRHAGFDVIADLDDIVTVDIPLDRVNELASMPQVKYVSFGTVQNTDMKFARPSGSVDAAQNGFSYNGQTLKFDGSGVIAGLMDTGMDASHVNFTDGDNTRVERLWWFRNTTGSATEYNSETLSSFVTDDANESHATHVAGIMAGSYKGNAQVAQFSSPSGGTISTGTAAMPYYGVATGARLAFSVGGLYDANIINGVTKIIEYAESQGVPCVVNMSLGSNSGPHDGSTSYNQALAKLGQRGIICMSAGNEGADNLFVSKAFTVGDTELKTMIQPSQANGAILPSGIVDVWGKTDKQLTVCWGVYDAATRIVTRMAQITTKGQSVAINSSNSTFNSSFTGSISMASEVNPLNNRFHVQCSLSTVTRRSTASTRYLALIVQGAAGEEVYVYGNERTVFTSNSMVGWEEGTPDGSINDGACGENIVCVGAYNSALYFPTLASQGYGYGAGNIDNISSFSSYGTTFQGVDKPDVCAPGSPIISSYSRYYYNSQRLTTNSISAQVVRAGVTNYWGPMQGTSMSCPFVSGTVALWLQANPSLKYSDIIETLKESSDFNSFSMRPAIRWGAGKINAVEGLKHILGKTSIGSVWNDEEQRLIITPLADGYEVWVAASTQVKATLYSLTGIAMTSASANGESVDIHTSTLPKGVYILCVDSDAGRHTSKVTVK